MKSKVYVGSVSGRYFTSPLYEIFRAKTEPTEVTHPRYNHVIGPWRSVQDAEYWCNHWRENMPLDDSLKFRATQHKGA